MTITVNTKPFDLFAQERDTVTLRDFTGEKGATLQFKRMLPKRTKDFPGMEKGEAKITTYRADGSIQGIYTVTSSVRADTLEADRVTDAATLAALAGSSAVVALIKEQRLPFNGN